MLLLCTVEGFRDEGGGFMTRARLTIFVSLATYYGPDDNTLFSIGGSTPTITKDPSCQIRLVLYACWSPIHRIRNTEACFWEYGHTISVAKLYLLGSRLENTCIPELGFKLPILLVFYYCTIW